MSQLNDSLANRVIGRSNGYLRSPVAVRLLG